MASAVLVFATTFLSIIVGPLVAGAAGALYLTLTRRDIRTATTSGALIVLGAIAAMIVAIVVSDIAYAIFG